MPKLVGEFEFVEWTPDDPLRRTKFVALREDKKAREVRRETQEKFVPPVHHAEGREDEGREPSVAAIMTGYGAYSEL